jgi:hypothetical protein
MSVATQGLTRVECCCGRTHRLTPSAMAIVIEMYQGGEGHIVTKGSLLEPICMVVVLSTLSIADPRRSKYRGKVEYVY